MFNKVLIANRGEIAARIIRTCKRLGIKTVVVYSDVDADSLFVKMADESYPLGGSHVKDSYLNIEKLIGIMKQSKADAVHPGYGLLSEHAEFAKKCRDFCIVFIGPSAEVISQMGSKIESRRAMEKAGVPVVPGIAYPLSDAEEAIAVSNQIGYPVMLKASSGGGGIGMQIVNNDHELEKAFEGNSKRALSFFGDGSMYVEKFIENPRHIEIQVLADQNGNTVFLWERECSIQRRNQKVLEEAPSPFLDEETRIKMGEVAINAAKAINYCNAGTIEFLVDRDKNFYFLEMNTRLQVEHPITEEITGIDLVEQQLRIAAGEQLAFNQDQIKREGHAIEVRIYAEDPKTFFPSPGKITKFSLPEGPSIRNELAVEEQSTITPYYDPMIAKLVVRGNNREDAINVLQEALNQYVVEGIKTNIPVLKEIVSHPAYKSGETTTDFIYKHILKKASLK